MPPRQRESTMPSTILTIMATSVISASSAMLVSSYYMSNTGGRESAILDDAPDNEEQGPPERIRSSNGALEVVTRLSARYSSRLSFLSKDLPLWLGAGYLILHPARYSSIQSQERFSDKLLDFLVVGLLLTYRGMEGGDSSSLTSDHQSSTHTKQVESSNKLQSDDEVDKRVLLLESPSPNALDIVTTPIRRNLQSQHTAQDSVTSLILDDAATERTPPTIITTNIPTEPTRYLEMMVYNVSHTDMVLSLDAPLAEEELNTTESSFHKFCLCRPRFSAFDYFSKKVLQAIPTLGKNALVRFPRYERSDDDDRYPIKPEPMAQQQLPIGFSLPSTDSHDSLQVTFTELNDLRIRGRDSSRIANFTQDTTTSLNAIFFPLIGTLMPQWQAMIQQKYNITPGQQQQTQPKQVLFLVSGVGSPRNWTHSMTGNSTQVCAELMQHYLQTLYPRLIVVRVHSETNIFRYDENISFVQNELMPCVQAYRDAHAKGLAYPDEVMKTKTPSKTGLALINAGRTMDNLPFMDDWKKSFHVTLSFGDGSPARNHAIQAALRSYRPTYYHCWQLKTFWHESKIVDSDIEIHSFEEMETVPALATKQLQDKPLVMQVVDEIKSFSMEISRVLLGDHHDIQKFWLRKTHKPVLAVLAVQMPNGRIKLYRGTNMEVSMPTGSLCAERNVIGTALADNPGLKRQDLKAIAVLSVPQPRQQKGRLARSGSVASYCSLPSLAPELFDNEDSPKLLPSYSSEILVPLVGEGNDPSAQQDRMNGRPRSASNASGYSLRTPPLYPNTIAEASGGSVPPAITLGPAAVAPQPVAPSPARRVSVYSGLENGNSNSNNKRRQSTKSRKRHLFVHSGDVSYFCLLGALYELPLLT